MKKRHLAIALSIAMAVNLSVPGFAASEEERITVTEENEKSEGSEDSKEESEISEEPKEEIEKSEGSEEEIEKAEGSDGETEKSEESGSESEKTEASEDEKSEEIEKEDPEGDDEESDDDGNNDNSLTEEETKENEIEENEFGGTGDSKLEETEKYEDAGHGEINGSEDESFYNESEKEEDSSDKEKNAISLMNESPEDYAKSVIEALSKGEDVVLEQDVTAEDPVIIKGEVTLDLGGYTLYANGTETFTDSKLGEKKTNILIDGDVKITDGTIISEADAGSYNYLIMLKSDDDKLELTDSLTIGGCDMNGAVGNNGGELETSANIINTASGKGGSIDTYGGKVTLNGGKIDAYYGIGIFDRAYDKDSEGAEVTINNAEIICYAYAASTNNIRSGKSNLTINAGNFKSSDRITAIYWPSAGTVTLGKSNADNDDLIIEGATPIEICSGQLIVNSGTYIGTGSETNYDGLPADYVANSGSAGCGDAITVIVNRIQAYAQYPLNIEINGGKFYSNNNYAFRYVDGNASRTDENTYLDQDININIKDGYFSGALGTLKTFKAGAQLAFSGGFYGNDDILDYITAGNLIIPTTDSEYPYAVVEKDDIKFNTEINGKRSTKATLDLNPDVAKSSLTAEIIQSGPKDVEIDTSALGEYTWTITPVEGNIPATVNASGTEATFTASEIGRAIVEVSCDALEDVILAEFDLTVVDSTKGTGAAEDGITEVKAEVGETAPPSVSGITEEQKSQLETDSKTAVDNAVDSVCNNADVHSSTVETTVRTDTIDNVPAPSENEKIVLGTSQTLNNVSLEAVTQTDEDGNIISVAPVIRSVTYEIVPTYQMLTTDGQPVTETTVFDLIKGQVRMTFRIPVPSSVTDRYARVEHISDDYGTSTGYYTVETGDNGGKYITYTTDHFSTFKLTFTNDRPSGGGSHGGSSKGSPLTSRATYYADGTVKTNDGTWHEDEKGWWFELPDGTWPVSMWRECPWNGVMNWYHFNAEGYLDSGWFTDADGNVYYLHDVHDGNFGYMYKGTKLIEGANYYFTEEEVENGLPEGALAR